MADQWKHLNKLNGQRVLIIGGSSGIGFGVAEACIEYGCIITISASSEVSAEKALRRLQAAYPSSTDRINAVSCNLGDEATLEDNIAQLLSAVTSDTKLDHIIFTAGDAVSPPPLKETSLEYIKKAGIIRFWAPLLVAKNAVSTMNPGPRSSFTITSGAASQKPIPGWAVPGAYLAGVHGMARGLALDMKPIRVNTIVPGVVDTELWAMDPAPKETVFNTIAKNASTTGSVGNVSDVAESFVGVLKDYNMTGTVISTNSGSLLV